MNVDQSILEFDKFKKIFNQYKYLDLTESDTRSKLLDIVLIQILGWSENNIDREKFIQTGYYDYLISIPGFSFVLEAKKKFVELKLPTNHKTSTLNALIKGNKDVID